MKVKPFHALTVMMLSAFFIAGCAPQKNQATDILTNQNISADEAMANKDEAMTEDKSDATMEDDNKPAGFSGTILAGTSAPLIDFNQADYQKALDSGKIVLLYFYANWCPICREEVPKMESAFNQLTTDQVVGFRVNFNDNQTDDNEKSLARQFGVAYQHTKVILQAGQKILKAPDSWDTKRYLDEINKLTQ